jgi:excinuclease ABC subunit B
MLKLARELKFEEAAALRDEIADLKQALILMPGLDD